MPGKFIRVKCEKCGNEQYIYDRAAMDVKCLVCGETLAKSTGGKVKLLVKVAVPLNE